MGQINRGHKIQMKPPNLPTPLVQPFRIMFVCLGNICRSPAAQGVMESLVRAHSLETQIEVDSAGTARYHIARLPDARMVSTAAKRGYKLESLAKGFTKTHVADRQLVVAMDRDNYAEILRVSGTESGHRGHIRKLSDYLNATWPRDVPDPYYGGEAGFEYVLDMLEQACPKILAECMQWTSP